MAELYNEGLIREGLLRTTNLVLPGLISKFDTIEEFLTRFAVNGVEAALALDFIGGEYRTANTSTTFADAFTGNSPKLTYSTTSNSTMVNSAGEIVWAPHNLVDYSDGSQAQLVGHNTTDAATPIEGFSNSLYFDGDGSLSLKYFSGIPSGVLLTLSIYVELDNGEEPTFPSQPGAPFAFIVGGISPSYGSGYTVTNVGGNVYQVSTTMISGSSGQAGIIQHTNQTIPFKVTRWQCYRSDLGGMHPVPGADTGFEYYVPTNGNAEYLPRVGHHVYNGSTWVNEGLLIESEARSNLEPDSNPVTPWTSVGMDYAGQILRITGPDGVSDSMFKLQEDTSNGSHEYARSVTVPIGTNTFSCVVKDAGDGRWVYWRTNNDGPDQWINVNPATGEVTEVGTAVNDYGVIDLGNGFYRLWFSCDSADGVSGWVLATSNTATPGNSIPSFTGTSEAGFYGGFVQVEAGSTPSSYMPTSGGTYTRTAQSLEVPANWYDVDNPTYTGPELVADFSTYADQAAFDVDWTRGTGWTFSGGVADKAPGTQSNLTQSGILQIGQVYEVTYTISNYVAGNFFPILGSNFNVARTANGTYTDVLQTTSADFAFVANSAAEGSIDNISVRQVSAPQFGWPEPEYIGSALYTSDFSATVDGWTAQGQGTIAAVSSELEVTGDGGYNDAGQKQISTVAGKHYVVRGKIRTGTSSAARLQVREAFGSFGVATAYLSTSSTLEDFTLYFTASGTAYNLQLNQWSGAGGTIYTKDISVREINPLSVSIQMDGRMTYADNDVGTEGSFVRWQFDSSNRINTELQTNVGTGRLAYYQSESGTLDAVAGGRYAPGVNVPFNISSRHGSTFVNGAVDGVALTEDTTPTALPDLSSTDLQIAYDFMGTIGTFRQFAGDIGDTGLVTATNPSTEPTLSLTFDGTGGSFYNLSWSE